MLKDKIKGLPELKRITLRLKKLGKKIVFTNGCFDLLHLGHVKYLEETKKKGDILIVGVNSDASMRRLKGSKRPIINQADRMGLIAALESTDFVVVFNEDTPLKLIKELKPDILAKGADWSAGDIVGNDIIMKAGGKVARIKLLKGRSTSGLIKRIAERFKTEKA